MPSQNSSGSGLQLQADGNSEQEDLKLRLQMRQLQNEQQAMADQRLKEEVSSVCKTSFKLASRTESQQAEERFDSRGWQLRADLTQSWLKAGNLTAASIF